MDGVVEGFHPRVDRRAWVEFTDRIVEEERRGRPETDERGDPRITASSRWHRIGLRFPGKGIVHGDRAHRRQVLVGLRGEIVPDVPRDRIGRERAAGIGLGERHRYSQIRREEIVGQEIAGLDDFFLVRLELVHLGPGPIGVEAVEIAFPGAAVVREEGIGLLRQLARVATRAAFGEHVFAAVELRGVLTDIFVAARRILQIVGLRGRQEEQSQIRRLTFRGLPIGRMRAGGVDLDRRDRLAADQRIEMRQPFLAEEADVDIDAVQRS